ncbi:hypothetical protein JVU11DRAFT_7648 [Chiua virens]|nr:hypothetical protein JVU11DRAFT_7648 [Chiua virens]
MRKEPMHVLPFKNPKFSPSNTHPHYHITAYGCSKPVYKAAEWFNNTFKRLLATHDFLLEHPRGDDSRSAVMKMKPAWRRGGDTFHWVSDELLNPTNPNEPETEVMDNPGENS